MGTIENVDKEISEVLTKYKIPTAAIYVNEGDMRPSANILRGEDDDVIFGIMCLLDKLANDLDVTLPDLLLAMYSQSKVPLNKVQFAKGKSITEEDIKAANEILESCK